MFGPDGAGKSTHVELLVRYLNENGVKAKKIWVRSPHTLAFLIWGLLRRLGKYSVETNHLGKEFYRPRIRTRLSRNVWGFIELISMLPHLFGAYFLIKRGYLLVAERYVIDSIATIAYYLDDRSFIAGHTAKLLLKFLPLNSVLIFLDATYDVIARRRGAIAEPMTFIEMQRYAYHYYSKIFGCDTIYTENYSVQASHQMILDIIHSRLQSASCSN